MRVLKTLAFLLLATAAMAQDGMDITITSSNDSKCVSINLTSLNSEDILLRGQNYRLFYNNNNVDYTALRINAEMALSNFDAEIAIHKNGLSKEINGKIPFETNMGFISMNIMPDDEIADFAFMPGGSTMTVSDVCFDSEVNVDDIILARRNITSEYSSAYSVIDWEAAEEGRYTMDLNALGDDESID